MVEDSLKKGTESSKEGHIVVERLVDVLELSEIPSAESARNRHLIETLNKGEEPEEHEQDVDLRNPLIVVEHLDSFRVVLGQSLRPNACLRPYRNFRTARNQDRIHFFRKNTILV